MFVYCRRVIVTSIYKLISQQLMGLWQDRRTLANILI